MLKNFENWLLENKYSALTAADYMGRVERLCRKEGYTLAHLVENIFLLKKQQIHRLIQPLCHILTLTTIFMIRIFF